MAQPCAAIEPDPNNCSHGRSSLRERVDQSSGGAAAPSCAKEMPRSAHRQSSSVLFVKLRQRMVKLRLGGIATGCSCLGAAL